MVVQSVGVQDNGGQSSNNGHLVNGSPATPASNGRYSYNSSNSTGQIQYNPYQVEVRANGSNVLLSTAALDPYQYPIDPVYGCTRDFGTRAGSWSCLTWSGLEPKSKMFYLLSTLIILGIVVMILTLIAAIVVFYQCEYLFPSFPRLGPFFSVHSH